MNSRSAVKRLLTALAASFVMASLHAAADASGKWEIEAIFDEPDIEAGGFDCVVKQDAQLFIGTCSESTASLAGEIDGQTITWRVSNSEQPPVTTTFIGTLNRSGTAIEGRFSSGTKGGTFSAAKT
jgi:hypothetical protein